MPTFYEQFKSLITGKASKKGHGLFFYPVIIFCILFFSISLLLYSNYSMFKESVSSLGIRSENPRGYLVWNFGMIILGILLLPHFFYFYNSFHPIANITSKISVIISSISCVALIGVGIFPENTIYPHYTCAIIAIFGFFVSFCHNLYILIKKRNEHDNWPNLKWLIIIYFQLIIIMVLFIFALISFAIYHFYDVLLLNLNLPFLEWLVLISDLIYLIGIFCLIQEEK